MVLLCLLSFSNSCACIVFPGPVGLVFFCFVRLVSLPGVVGFCCVAGVVFVLCFRFFGFGWLFVFGFCLWFWLVFCGLVGCVVVAGFFVFD